MSEDAKPNGLISRALTSARTTASNLMFQTRSLVYGRHSNAHYEAASGSTKIPLVPNTTPTGIVQSNVRLRSLTRYLHNNDPWLRALIDRMCDRVIGRGPLPNSPDNNLNSLWAAQTKYIDERGISDFGSWLRNEVYKPFLLDGESFVRKFWLNPVGFDYVNQRPLIEDGAATPLQLRSMTAEWVPEWMTYLGEQFNSQPARTITGIVYSNVRVNKRIAYWVYDGHPYDLNSLVAGQTLFAHQIPADDIFHVMIPNMPGSPRGENRMASIVIRALALQRYEDAVQKRKDMDNALSVFIKESADSLGDAGLPGEKVISDLMSHVSMLSFGVIKLPAGMDIQQTDPKPNAAGDEFYLKFQLTAFAAVFGIPIYELTQDYTAIASDRVAKFATVNFGVTIDRERGYLERFLGWAWRNHVDSCYVAGLWKPATGKQVSDYYDISWSWPFVQTATLKADVDAFAEAVKSNFVDSDTASRALFNVSGEESARRIAAVAARNRALGINTPPVAPATATAPATPAWDADANPLTTEMVSDAEAREVEAYQKYQTDFGRAPNSDQLTA